MITNFHESGFEFLSNFYPCEIEYKGMIFNTSEHLYQSFKCTSLDDVIKVKNCTTPGKAKRITRKMNINPNWDKIKVNVMLAVLRLKFSNPEMREKLLNTGNELLIEGNHWNDTFWGMIWDGEKWKGENHLGKLLMQVRNELRGQKCQ